MDMHTYITYSYDNSIRHMSPYSITSKLTSIAYFFKQNVNKRLKTRR